MSEIGNYKGQFVAGTDEEERCLIWVSGEKRGVDDVGGTYQVNTTRGYG